MDRRGFDQGNTRRLDEQLLGAPNMAEPVTEIGSDGNKGLNHKNISDCEMRIVNFGNEFKSEIRNSQSIWGYEDACDSFRYASTLLPNAHPET